MLHELSTIDSARACAWTRRNWIALAATPVLGQGIASRNVRPQPRGKASGLPFAAQFTDVARLAGLTAPTIYGFPDKSTYILESTGCGCAFFDYDNDGWLDILLLSGMRLGGTPQEATNRLYKNNRDGTFTDVTVKAGLERTGWASAITIGDFNNDGHEDIFVTGWNGNVLYRNNGDGTFTDVTTEAGLAGKGRWGAGCAWLDYDRDGKLDLFVANYLEFDFDKVPNPGATPNCTWRGQPVFCGPQGLPYGRHSLYRNNGDGTFTDVSERSGIAAARRSYGMTAVAADFDNDGWPDIYLACDSSPSLLFRNNRDGSFTEEGLKRGVALNEDGRAQAGMGIGIGDFDLDGSLDVVKTHFSDDTNVLYRNDGKGNFVDDTVRAGLAVETRFTGWGAGIVDLDNDGLPDIFLVTGGVFPGLENRLPAYPYRSPRLIFRNLGGGKFEQLIGAAGPGIEAVHSSRGCAFGDFDNDGDLDILVLNLNEAPSLLRNDLGAGAGNWLKLQFEGVKSNRSAIGTRATVSYGGRTQSQEVVSQSSFYSVSDRRLHFGLGKAEVADLAVRWSNGLRENLKGLKPGSLYLIREGEGIVRRQEMKAS